MDRFSAHLDRGWDLVQHGDSQGAELSARRALELNKQAPEAYNLLGYAAALRGDFEAAIQHYNHALALDETDQDASLDTVLGAAAYFRLGKSEALAIAKEVGIVVATWREVAGQHGLTANQIDRMASAFEHDDLARAIA